MAAKYRTEIVGNLAYIVRQKKDGKQETLCRGDGFLWAEKNFKFDPCVFTRYAAEAVVWALNEA